MSCSECWNPSYKQNKEELWKCPFFLITAAGFPVCAFCVCVICVKKSDRCDSRGMLEKCALFTSRGALCDAHMWSGAALDVTSVRSQVAENLELTCLTSPGLHLAFCSFQMTFNLLIFHRVCVCFCVCRHAYSCFRAEKWIWFALGVFNACKSPASVSGE